MASTRRPGISVDTPGRQVVDPTANVIALVEANANAARALRDSDIKFNDAVTSHLKEIDVLRDAHIKETRLFDSERYDKIRSVDMANAAATASQILQAVTTNASTQERTAQTLRDQVAATATAAENRQAAFAADMVKRLSAVELSMSEGKGKQQVSDPQMDKLTILVEKLAHNQTLGSGKSEGLDTGWKLLIGIAALLFGFLAWQDRQTSSSVTPAPQVIYIPAAPGTLIPSPAPQTGAPR